VRLIAFSRAPAFVAAEERGLFAAERLAVSFTRATSSTAQLDALLAGEFDVAHSAADNVIARVDGTGADLRVVLVVDRGAEHRLIGSRDTATLRDMDGRLLGVDSPQSGHALMAYVLLTEAGVPRGRYRTLAVGGTAERYAALLEGRVDAALLSPPHDERAVGSGCHVLAETAERFADLPGLAVAVRRTWADANRDQVTAYCRALLAGARLARDERPLNASVAEMTRTIEAACALRRATGMASGKIDASRYFDPSFAVAANPTLA
jgi:ABC-type nitrate/sulfonate/bicarbonate transport system substrate-binding protein